MDELIYVPISFFFRFMAGCKVGVNDGPPFDRAALTDFPGSLRTLHAYQTGCDRHDDQI